MVVPIKRSAITSVQVTVVQSLWTAEQVAAFFQVNKRQVLRWISEGKMQSVCTPGGGLRIQQSEIDRILQESKAKI